MALLSGYSADLTGTGEPQRVLGARVSWNLFQMLGVQPQIGRSFRPEEDQLGHDSEVIVNSEFWRSRLGGDPHAIGRKITLNGEPYEVIGVLPANFRFPKLSQLFAMTIPEERPEIWKPFARKLPEKLDLRAVLLPLQSQIVGRSRLGLQMVLIAVGVVLLIACVNEMGIRMTLGAQRKDITVLELQEGLQPVVAGLVSGVLLSVAAGRLMTSLLFGVTAPDPLAISGVAFSLLAVALLATVLPALPAVRIDPAVALRYELSLGCARTRGVGKPPTS